MGREVTGEEVGTVVGGTDTAFRVGVGVYDGVDVGFFIGVVVAVSGAFVVASWFAAGVAAWLEAYASPKRTRAKIAVTIHFICFGHCVLRHMRNKPTGKKRTRKTIVTIVFVERLFVCSFIPVAGAAKGIIA